MSELSASATTQPTSPATAAPKAGGRWDDLMPRLISGAVMVGVGVFAIWMGGIWFQALVSIATGLMIWELTRMVAPEVAARGVLFGQFSVALIMAVPQIGALWILPWVIGLALVATLTMPRRSSIYAIFFSAILIAGYGLVTFRSLNGVTWLFWMVIVVVVTDVFGYFAGRFIGGPKFWPRVSPKKTWSGTVAGWIGAGLVGAIFLIYTTAGRDLIWISMLLSFASQMGDVAESALKRRVGVKDSSNLIPGHGGLFDRFDGLLGAALFMLLVASLVEVPEVRF
ncbi:MAG: phosphatidate cytidylyltransferase [Rhodobacteraceae bacterium]|nr:phosphatidate cytidylyltransferase [Paracoccaceae bacterium]